MMKKMKNLTMVFMVAFLLFVGFRNVRADNNICTPSQLSELRSTAANIKVTYTPVTDAVKLNSPGGEFSASSITYRYLDVKIYNVAENMYVQADNENENWVLSARDIMEDGSITIRQPSSPNTMYNFTFKIISYDYGCSLETLRTIRLTLPKFNSYSELDVCKDIPDYYLCQQYTTYSVDGSTFYDKVEEYKTKLLTLEEEKILAEEESNNNAITNTLSKVSKYKYVIVGIIVVVGVVLTVIVLKKKGSAL